MGDEQITTGELMRTCQRIQETLTTMQQEAKSDRHELRNGLHALGLTVGVHDEQIKAIAEKQSSTKQWIGGVVSGGLVSGLALLWERLTKGQ